MQGAGVKLKGLVEGESTEAWRRCNLVPGDKKLCVCGGGGNSLSALPHQRLPLFLSPEAPDINLVPEGDQQFLLR